MTTATIISRSGSVATSPPGPLLVARVSERPPLRGIAANARTFAAIRSHRYDCVLATYQLFPCAWAYRLLTPKSSLVVDVRSIPVGENALQLLPATCLLVWALTSRAVAGVTWITRSMYDLTTNILPHSRKWTPGFWESGVDCTHFLPRQRDQKLSERLRIHAEFVVGYHGSISRTRGLLQFVDVAQFFRHRRSPPIFLLIGAGDALGAIRAEVERRSLDSLFRFVDAVPYEEIPDYLSLVDVGVVPYPDNWRWRHQSPLKVLEYLAMGIPVVATDLPAHRGISEAVRLVSSSRPEEIASSIQAIRNLPETSRNHLAEIARESAMERSWDQQAGRLLRYLDSVTSDSVELGVT